MSVKNVIGMLTRIASKRHVIFSAVTISLHSFCQLWAWGGGCLCILWSILLFVHLVFCVLFVIVWICLYIISGSFPLWSYCRLTPLREGSLVSCASLERYRFFMVSHIFFVCCFPVLYFLFILFIYLIDIFYFNFGIWYSVFSLILSIYNAFLWVF